jgi:hypothetical protein
MDFEEFNEQLQVPDKLAKLNPHPRDALITFEEKGHAYKIYANEEELVYDPATIKSVSKVAHALSEDFPIYIASIASAHSVRKKFQEWVHIVHDKGLAWMHEELEQQQQESLRPQNIIDFDQEVNTKLRKERSTVLGAKNLVFFDLKLLFCFEYWTALKPIEFGNAIYSHVMKNKNQYEFTFKHRTFTISENHLERISNAFTLKGPPHAVKICEKIGCEIVLGKYSTRVKELPYDAPKPGRANGSMYYKDNFSIIAEINEDGQLKKGVVSIIKGWDKKRDMGTRLHRFAEFLVNDVDIAANVPNPIHFKQIRQFFKDNSSVEWYRTEWRVFADNIPMPGTIDLVSVSKRNSDNDVTHIDLWDYKTTNGERFLSTKARMKEPLQDLESNDLMQYSLQMNLYKWIIDNFYGIRVNNMYLVQVHPDIPNYIVIPVRNLQEQVNLLLDSVFTELRGSFFKTNKRQNTGGVTDVINTYS